MAGTTFTTRQLRRKQVRARERKPKVKKKRSVKLESKIRFEVPKPQLNVIFIPNTAGLSGSPAQRKAEKERLEKLRKQMRRTDI